jgi:hypothetical protein
MPSLQQVRSEALADAVERATRPPLLLTLLNVAAGPLDVRLECHDGASIEFRLLEVVLDGGEILGRAPSGASVCLPLDRVKTIWHHRRRIGRSLSLWCGTMLGSAAGGALVASTTAWTEVATGALVGALFGSVAGIGVVLLFDRWKALYQWVLLYDSAAA